MSPTTLHIGRPCHVMHPPGPREAGGGGGSQREGFNGHVAASALGSGRACTHDLHRPLSTLVASSALRSTDALWPASLPEWLGLQFPGPYRVRGGHSGQGVTPDLGVLWLASSFAWIDATPVPARLMKGVWAIPRLSLSRIAVPHLGCTDLSHAVSAPI